MLIQKYKVITCQDTFKELENELVERQKKLDAALGETTPDALPMGDTRVKCLYINSHQQGIGGNQNSIDHFARINGVLDKMGAG